MATFEELTGLPVPTTASRPLETIHQSGPETRRAAAVQEDELYQETSILDTAKAALQRNITTMMFDEVQRKWSHQPEEHFDPAQWVTENSASLPGVNLEEFATVRSTGEAEELRADMIRAETNDAAIAARGYTGMAVTLLAGIVDPAEVALAIATGGTSKAATVGGRLARTTAAGVRGALASSVAVNAVDPLATTEQVIFGALTGAVMAGGFGTAQAAFSRSTRQTAADFNAAARDLPDASIEHTDAPAYFDSPQSLGAASTAAPQAGFNNPSHQAVFDQSMVTIRDNNLGVRTEDTDFDVSTPEGRTAKRFSDLLATKTFEGMRNDFDRLANGGSRIEAALGFNLMESPDGRVRNNRSASMLKENYEQRIATDGMIAMEEGFNGWAAKRHVGLIDKHWKPETREAFDREVFAELEARFHEGKPVSGDIHVKAAADGIDAGMAKALEVAKGRPGETSVTGFEDIQPKSGFMAHKWSGAAIRKMMAKGHTRAKMEKVFELGYAKSYPNMKPAYRTMVSKAVLRRALAKGDGVDVNMLNTMDSDAQDYLRELLTDSGYDTVTIDKLIDSIRGKKEDQSKMGTAKARVQVDMRTQIDGLSLMDLADTNLTRVVSQYNRQIAGSAALARKGIPNKAVRKNIIDAAMAERSEKGLNTDKQRQYLEDVFTYFDAGPIGGGVDPNVSRAKQLTNLALLNQMGMTQMGEVGAQIAAVGMDTWRKHAAVIYKEMRTQGPDGPIAQELRPWMGQLGKEHMLFRQDLMLDELGTSRDLNTFLGKLDFGLGKGQRIQGYASGFFHVKAFQQKVAVMSQADKVMQRLRDGKDLELLDALGMPRKLKKYIDNGMVEFDADGYLDKLNLDKWSADDAEDFTLALGRHTHQVVQKSLSGEENMWMHKTVGSLYMHLKSFPLLAMRKQAIRLAGTQRAELVAATLMGLATAGLAYEARQLINGKPENISPMHAVKGAIGMSNMTGWIPMLADPGMAMLGMNDLRFNQYGRHEVSSGIIATPPVIPTLNKMAHGIGAINPLSDLSRNERIRIMQTTPLVGNAYGFSAIFNAMKT